MDRKDYRQSYSLQDRGLSTLFGVEKKYYLTGGTCLSRFYLDKRYSDDLGLFADIRDGIMSQTCHRYSSNREAMYKGRLCRVYRTL